MGDSSANMLDFGFAFDDKDFSDRVLNIEIIPEEMRPINPTDRKDSGCTNGAILKTLYVSSPILAVQSPLFHKLFKNDMKQRDVTLRINSTEELSSLMDVLNFMYKNTLCATTSSDLLGVLMVADKFEVTCCMEACVKALLELPMSQDSALSYLELPPSVSASKVVKPLIDASKKYLATRYMDFDEWSQKSLIKLPLHGIEVVLGSDGLQVESEDDVVDFIVDWARINYSKSQERQELIEYLLTRFVCFRNMSCSKLKDAHARCNLGGEKVSKLILEALFSKLEAIPYEHVSRDGFPGRVYTHWPIKVVQLESPWPRPIVYLNLTKDECVNRFPSKEPISSKTFLLDGRPFFLMAECYEEPPHHFGLYLCRPKGSKTCTIDFEFSVVHKSSKDFQSKLKVNNRVFDAEGNGSGKRNLFGMSWTEFMSDECEYFINGILHLRAELTLVNS